jgi:hypothetical protein
MNPRHVTIFFTIAGLTCRTARAPRSNQTRQALRLLRNICTSSPAYKWFSTRAPPPSPKIQSEKQGLLYYAALAMALSYTAYSRGNKISLSQPPTKNYFRALSLTQCPALNASTTLPSISGIVSLPSLSSTVTKGETNHERQAVIGQAKRHLTPVDRCPCPSDISTRSGLDTTVALTCQYKYILRESSWHENQPSNSQVSKPCRHEQRAHDMTQLNCPYRAMI